MSSKVTHFRAHFRAYGLAAAYTGEQVNRSFWLLVLSKPKYNSYTDVTQIGYKHGPFCTVHWQTTSAAIKIIVVCLSICILSISNRGNHMLKQDVLNSMHSHHNTRLLHLVCIVYIVNTLGTLSFMISSCLIATAALSWPALLTTLCLFLPYLHGCLDY